MLHTFTQNQSQPIAADRPQQIISVIKVSDLKGKLAKIEVVLDIDHSDPRDLVVKLVANGEEWSLHDRDHDWLRQARRKIWDFGTSDSGVGSLFDTLDPNTEWKLVVQDLRRRDGGQLNWWRLELEVVDSNFNIEVRFKDGLTPNQQAVFQIAAARWSEIIVGDLPEASIGTDLVDDVLIWAEGRVIDGPGAILGQAGPTHLRASSMLPIAGSMSFDSADLAEMEKDGTLLPVILHEMGHVLGFGTIWRLKGLLTGAGTDDPRFVGEAAKAEWMKLGVHIEPPELGVPVANTGGSGTRDAHWRESVFHDELMTGYIDSGINPLSRITIASLQDLGYVVDMAAADAFEALMKLLRGMTGKHRQCSPARFNPIVVEGT